MEDPARENRIALPQLGQIAISSVLTVSTCMALSYFRVGDQRSGTQTLARRGRSSGH